MGACRRVSVTRRFFRLSSLLILMSNYVTNKNTVTVAATSIQDETLHDDGTLSMQVRVNERTFPVSIPNAVAPGDMPKEFEDSYLKAFLGLALTALVVVQMLRTC